MRLYIDLDSEFVLSQPVSYPQSSIVGISLKRCAATTLEVQFLRRGVAVELSPDAAGVWGIKPEGEFDGPYAAEALAWVKVGTGASTYYVFSFALINATLDALFAKDAVTDNDVTQVVLMGALKWTVDGTDHESPNLVVTITNNVNRGGEATPALTTIDYGVFLPLITRLVGGTAIDLDNVITARMRTGFIVMVLIEGGSPSELQWRPFVLVAGAADPLIDNEIAPLDFDATTNNRHWRGATAPSGPQGDPGVDGVDGDDGAPGTDGADGTDGSDGADGADGSNGTDGGTTYDAPVAIPAGATPTVDLSASAMSTARLLAANTTITLSSPVAGKVTILHFKQAAAASYTVDIPDVDYWVGTGGIPSPMSTTFDAVDACTIWSDGTNIYGSWAPGA